jgi:hypothetical protein
MFAAETQNLKEKCHGEKADEERAEERKEAGWGKIDESPDHHRCGHLIRGSHLGLGHEAPAWAQMAVTLAPGMHVW